MRVMVALENRFIKTRNGNIYSTTVCDYTFWKRYLQVFDEVVVFARVAKVEHDELEKQPANGPGVSFIELPTFIGLWQCLANYFTLKKMAKESVSKADAFILRIPGTIGCLLEPYLRRSNYPYGVEVVGDANESITQASVKGIFSPMARYLLTMNQKKQCQNAVAASYVSKNYLQHRYPPACWSTHYSSIELSDETVIDADVAAAKLKLIRTAIDQRGVFNICHVGSMSALYKAQDVLMEAVALCRKKGFDMRLKMIGDGKYENVFRNKAKELDISEFVDFVGRVPPGRPVREFLDNSDLFVLPSLTEGLPRALIEAMARALPCIASNVGGIKELLLEEDMISPGDAKQLANKIMAVLADPVKMQEMATRNLEKSKEYRSSELNKRRIEFYKKVVEASEERIAQA